MIVYFYFVWLCKFFKDFEWVNIGEVNCIVFSLVILINVILVDCVFYIFFFKVFGFFWFKIFMLLLMSVKGIIFILGVVVYVVCIRNILF